MEPTSARPPRLVWALIPAILLTAAVTVVWVNFRLGEEDDPAPPLLGSEFRDEELKLAFTPPGGWKLSPMPEGFAEAFILAEPLLVKRFEGPNFGDLCVLVVFESDQSLATFAQRTLAQIPPEAEPSINHKFIEMDGLDGWGCEWVIKHDAYVHQLVVLLKRGRRRISLTYSTVQTRFAETQPAIQQSIKSLDMW